MKSMFLILGLLFVTSFSYAQDTIRKKDGTLYIGIVKEIDDSYLIYVREDQPDGPLRKIELSQVSMITYKDGTRERFTVSQTPSGSQNPTTSKQPEQWEPGTINNTGRVVIIKRRGPDIRVYPGDRFPSNTNDLPKGNLYLNLLVGYAQTSRYEYTLDYYNYSNTLKYIREDQANMGVRFGALVYFGNGERHKFGLNIAFVGLNIMVNDGGDFPNIVFAPVNPGFASSFNIGENSRLEANATMGLAVSSLFQSSLGFRYGIDLKYRYRSLAFGLDFSRAQSEFDLPEEYANMVSLVIGWKFGR